MSDWHGAESLRPFLVPVTFLTTHPDNPRRGDLDIIAESLRVHGQMKPIIVNEAPWRIDVSGSPCIVAGNHTYLAAVEKLGWEQIARLPVELEATRERQYLLADNRSSDLGAYYDRELVRILQELQETGDLEGTGYSPDDLDDLLSALNEIAEAPIEQFLGDYAETREQLEARTASRGTGTKLKEVRLLYDPETAKRFAAFLGILSKEWGKELTVHDRVYRAVEEAARRANQEE